MVKKNIKLLVFILIPFFITSCVIYATGIFDNKLRLEKQDYKGNVLKLNGYYYQLNNNQIFGTILFYKNGVILYGLSSAPDSEPFSFMENQFKKYQIDLGYKNNKTNWGLFNIKDSVIQISGWYSSTGAPLESYLVQGKILNDTTFMLYNKGGNLILQDEIYHFKQFSPKPDSTNKYIK